MTEHYGKDTPHQIRKARLSAQRDLKAVEGVGRWPAAEAATKFGRPGQCQSCGAWRADGQPPTVHRTDCREGPAGWDLPAEVTADPHPLPAALRTPPPVAQPPAADRSPRGKRSKGKGRG